MLYHINEELLHSLEKQDLQVFSQGCGPAITLKGGKHPMLTQAAKSFLPMTILLYWIEPRRGLPNPDEAPGWYLGGIDNYLRNVSCNIILLKLVRPKESWQVKCGNTLACEPAFSYCWGL